jgi:hypothetical protein
MNKDSYDDDPVFYCKRCLSLNIRPMPVVDNQDYCADCSSADVGQTDIETWKKMYEEKYGHPYVQKRVLKWPYWC